MSNKQVVRRASNSALRAAARTAGGRVLRRAMANNRLRKAMRRWLKKKHQQARNQLINRNRGIYNKKFYKIKGMASGPTYTTTRMIVRRTPGRQKFLRKLFKTNPVKSMYVNRFGYAWMGTHDNNKTIWYSSTALKFNNIQTFMKTRTVSPSQLPAQSSTITNSPLYVGNMPDAYIYIGKCTYTYEIYNPTNYIITVFIYDLICKRDTPFSITYADSTNEFSSAPENMMLKGSEVQYENNLQTNTQWTIADPTVENNGTVWNSVGMKPTDYHYFNTFWKVKGMKKIVLAPTTAHHHVVVFNPKAKLTQASLYMPRQGQTTLQRKQGVAGLTISTLFGFQGQIGVENDQSTDQSTKVGTLPGKLIVSLVKKENVWSGSLSATQIISDTNLESLQQPKIFTDLVEQDVQAT